MGQDTQIQMELVSLRDEHMRELRIEGPTGCSHFFIRDTSNRVFDGETWRGFGWGEHYHSFQEAFIALRRKALPAHIATYRDTPYRGDDVIHDVDEVEAVGFAKGAARIEEERLYEKYLGEKKKWKEASPFLSFQTWVRRRNAAKIGQNRLAGEAATL